MDAPRREVERIPCRSGSGQHREALSGSIRRMRPLRTTNSGGSPKPDAAIQSPGRGDSRRTREAPGPVSRCTNEAGTPIEVRTNRISSRKSPSAVRGESQPRASGTQAGSARKIEATSDGKEIRSRTPDHRGAGSRDQIPTRLVDSDGMHQYGPGIESAQFTKSEHLLCGVFAGAFAQVNHEGRAGWRCLELLAHVGGELERDVTSRSA